MDFFLRTRQAFVLFSLMCLTAGFVAGVVFMNSLEVPETTMPIVLGNGGTDDANRLTLAPVTHVTGEVVSIGEGRFTIDAHSLKDPSVPPSFTERYIKVGEQTEISTVVQRAGAEEEMAAYERALDSWQKRYDAGEDVGAPPTLPQLYETKVMMLSDLQVGQTVSMVTENDVRLEKEFTPLSITVLPPPQEPIR